MSNRRATIDPLAEIFEPADEALAGIAQLRSSPPLWPVGFERWCDILAAVEAFERQHGPIARARGWSQTQLYGLHQRAPYARLSAMGAAWVIARTGHRVLEVDHIGMLLVTRTSARLRIVRAAPEGAMLAWCLTERCSARDF